MAYEIFIGRSESAKKKYGTKGTIFLGKHYVTMEREKSLSNPMLMDATNPHVVLVAGKRGSGKSYSLGVIAEGLANLDPEIAHNISTLIFDTMGIYWTMKYPNYRDDKLLYDWKLSPKALNPMIFVPIGLFDYYEEKGIPVDRSFAIRPFDVNAEEWCSIFGVRLISEEGILVEKAIEAGKDKYGENLDIKKIIEIIKKGAADGRAKRAVENMFLGVEKWGLFSSEGTELSEIFLGGRTSVLDLSAYTHMDSGEIIKALVIGFLSKKILGTRLLARKSEEVRLISEGGYLTGEEAATTGKEAPLIWIMIDEAHEFLPKEGETLATHALVQLLREGRQPGISLVLATQQPGKIHTDVMTQSDIVLSHRLTAKTDIEALGEIMQTYLAFGIDKYIDDLPRVKGAGIVLDDNSEKIYPIRIRPRISWHGGGNPSAIKEEIKQLELK